MRKALLSYLYYRKNRNRKKLCCARYNCCSYSRGGKHRGTNRVSRMRCRKSSDRSNCLSRLDSTFSDKQVGSSIYFTPWVCPPLGCPPCASTAATVLVVVLFFSAFFSILKVEGELPGTRHVVPGRTRHSLTQWRSLMLVSVRINARSIFRRNLREPSEKQTHSVSKHGDV